MEKSKSKIKGKEKVFLRLNGGLGNQMFQWAFGRMLGETEDLDVYLDMSYFSRPTARPYKLDVFNLEPKFVEGEWLKFKLDVVWKLRHFLSWNRFFGIMPYMEKHFNFDGNMTRIKGNTYIAGFFQSELYFKCIENTIREDFNFVKPASNINQRFIEEMRANNSVSVHIRRGDYVKKKRYAKKYATCTLDYYVRAIEYIAQRHPNPVAYIFSDDIPWVAKNLHLPCECVYVGHNTGGKSYEDMRLMSHCKHNVIANSSFSWWGAWLNKNAEKIVIAPKKWFNDERIIQTDVIPKGWVQLDN